MRIPTNVVTDFLGVGKTTAVLNLLACTTDRLSDGPRVLRFLAELPGMTRLDGVFRTGRVEIFGDLDWPQVEAGLRVCRT